VCVYFPFLYCFNSSSSSSWESYFLHFKHICTSPWNHKHRHGFQSFVREWSQQYFFSRNVCNTGGSNGTQFIVLWRMANPPWSDYNFELDLSSNDSSWLISGIIPQPIPLFYEESGVKNC
jgi:hypothetical protein